MESTKVRPRALLVEDNPGDARLFGEILGESDYEVDLCWEEDLSAGLQAVEEGAPDLVVTDLGLPDSEGPETVERLVEAAPELPVVVLTGQQTMEMALASLEAGATEYLRKDELLPGLVGRTLRTAVKRKRIEAKLRRQERALRQSRERYRSLFRDSSDAILVHDLEGRVKEANPKAEALFGVEAGELRGRAISSLFAVGEEDRARKKLEALQEGEPYRTVSRYERADGSEFWGELSATATEIGGETVVRTMIRDVTERKEAQEELRRQEARLRGLANSIPGALYQFSARPDGTYGFDYISEGAEDLLGISADPEDFLERGIERVPGPHRQRLLQSIEEAIQKEEAWEQEVSFEKPSGERIWIRAKSSPPERRGGELVFNGVILDVTERKERERTLRLLSEAVEQANEAVLVTEAEPLSEPGPRIVYANPAFEEMTGYGAEEILGKTPRVLQGPETEREVLDSLREALEAGRSWQGETINYQKDGTPFLLQWNVAPVTGEEGEIEYWVSVQRDVTEERAREEALREERDLLDRIFETSPVAIVRLDRLGRIVQASDRAEEVLGLEKNEITDRTYNDPEWSITKPDGSPMPDEELPFARVMSTGEPVYDIEHTIEWSDGSRRLLSISGAPLRTARGEIEEAVFHLEDITERREAQIALRESEERFRGVFENAALGMAVLNQDGELLEANPALREMTGYDAGELRGCHFGKVTHPDDLEADRQRYEELVAGERDRYQMEKRYVRKDGEVFWGRLIVSRHQGRDGQVIGMVEDIDEQKRHEKELRAAKEEAEEASRLKTAMLANMSHEIRTPLTAINGFAEILTEQLDGELRDFADRIERSGRRLMKTLDSVLQLSKLEAGTHELERESVRLEAVVTETVEMLRSSIERKSLTVETVLPDHSVTGHWNEGAVNRIVENLLENAIKFTPEGGRVSLRVREEEGGAMLEVEDTGVGIEEEAIADIFEAFKQESEGLDREYEGSGLGLSIVKELTESLGGQITVESEKGQGTCFTVCLPLAPQDE